MDKNWITVRISGAIDEAMDPDLLIEDREGIAKIYANEIAQAADKELVGLRTEIERYVQWVNDLQAGTYITCVYCGHNYGPDDEVPTSMAEVLKEHIENCPDHPMSALKRERDALRAQVAVIIQGVKPLRDFLEPIRELSPENTTLQERCRMFDEATSAEPMVA